MIKSRYNNCMRRKDRQLPEEAAMKVLSEGSHGVLAAAVVENDVYAIPISYAVEGRTVYFHGALEGRKVEIAKTKPRATLVTVTQDDIRPEAFTTKYTSAIADGVLRIVEDEEERMKGFRSLIRRYSPDFISQGDAYIDRAKGKTLIFALDIENIYGKWNT